jgi:SAM-dependent methyltransferase
VSVTDRIRPLARRLKLAAPAGHWHLAGTPPWERRPIDTAAGAVCNICRWQGESFDGGAHVEFAQCPQCGSIARDRFMHWCFIARTAGTGLLGSETRILETSPRLGGEYREWMRRWYDYRASDFDLSAHRADVQIDLQDIDLPDASLDVVLSSHVLEHVPDTHRALSELFRVLAPRGRLYLQIPLAWGQTFVPPEPTFHADNTPVFFNFGWDLTEQIRSAGFITTALIPHGHLDAIHAGPPGHDPASDGFDLDDMVTHARPEDLAVVATLAEQRILGFEPPWQHVTWECLRP